MTCMVLKIIRHVIYSYIVKRDKFDFMMALIECLLLKFYWTHLFFLVSLLSFLGYVDKLGVAYEAPTVATGFGAYLAQVGFLLLFSPHQVLKPLSCELIICAFVFAALDEGGAGQQGRNHKGWGTSTDRAMP